MRFDCVKTRTILAALLFALPASPAHAQQPAAAPPQPVITVTGSGEVAAAPDEAVVRVGVTRQASTAQEAQAAVNTVANQALEAVEKLGVPKSKIQTSQLQLHPLYAPVRPGMIPEEPRIVGYRATNTVSVTLDRLERVGPVIDAVLKAGGNQLEGVVFRLKDDGPQRREALKKAVNEAGAKAQTIAEALDVRLAGVLDVQESGAVSLPTPVFREFALGARAAPDSTPVSPGEVTVSATVTIRFTFRPK